MSGAWEVKDEYRNIFLEESQDQLQEWEDSILSLEKSPSDGETIDRLFRAVHTLKGSAGFVGFEGIQNLTHELETKLQDVTLWTRSTSSHSPNFQASLILRKLSLFRNGFLHEPSLGTLGSLVLGICPQNGGRGRRDLLAFIRYHGWAGTDAGGRSLQS